MDKDKLSSLLQQGLVIISLLPFSLCLHYHHWHCHCHHRHHHRCCRRHRRRLQTRSAYTVLWPQTFINTYTSFVYNKIAEAHRSATVFRLY